MADVTALVTSYSRLGLFKHISTVCSEVIAKKGNDSVLALWSAFSSAMEGALCLPSSTVQCLGRRDTGSGHAWPA